MGSNGLGTRLLDRGFDPLARASGKAACRGSTAVEMALVLPILLLFIFGVVEVSNLYRIALTLSKAAEMGAHVAVTGQGYDDGTRMAAITNTVKSYLTAIPAPAPVITVSSWPGINPGQTPVKGSAGQPCQLVEVRVDYTYTMITPIVGPIMGGHVLLSRYDRMVNEPWIPCL
jgi:Flp pilus assembly protein TadG